jgi:hypothetical protein
MNFEDSIERLRKYYRISNTEIEKTLGLSNGYISQIDKNPGKLLLALNEKGISTDWFLTGKGSMFLVKPETDSPSGNGLTIKQAQYSGMGNIQQLMMTPSGELPEFLPGVLLEKGPPQSVHKVMP